MPITEDHIREQLKLVIDPELFVNIVDLGLVYVVDIQPGEENKENVWNALLPYAAAALPGTYERLGASQRSASASVIPLRFA